MRKLTISVGSSRKETKWLPREMTWPELLEKLAQPIYTGETVSEYKRMSKDKQDDIKDVGGFVGGALRDGVRKSGNVLYRSLLTLDLDFAQPDTWETIQLLSGNACCIYSTHKSTRENPRLRLVAPIKRDISPVEYTPFSRKFAQEIDIEQFDDTTYEPSRLMYWSSTSADGEHIFKSQDGPWIDPDEFLAKYKDWRNVAEWPVSSRVEKLHRKAADKQGDPLLKKGAVGAFCRAYSIPSVIEEHLADVYTPCDGGERYTYINGSTSGGLVLYDGDTFTFSHHGSDPAGGKLCNAFDLVRIHKFGALDEDIEEDAPMNKRPSFVAMQEFAVNDLAVKKQLAIERQQQAQMEFGDEDWMSGLKVNKRGIVVDTLSNLILILSKDPKLKGVVFNSHFDGMEIIGEVPWKHPDKWWRDADDAQLISYIDSAYGLFSKVKYFTAIAKVADDRSYHPIKEYLNSLPEWDKVARVDTLLIDYFGAEDNEYVRAVTRKTLCAAVARVFKPGVKFDYMLVLNGQQGAGKSTFLRKLGGQWFNDSLSLSDTRDKTAAEKLQGFWLMEVGELAGLRKTDVETLKAFISRQDDVYRASFGRRATPHQRQCIFIGTTNSEHGFLRDITGNRRFWPVNLGIGTKTSWSMTEDEVAQIWAEVMTRYREGEELCLTKNLEQYAEIMQKEAMETDEREGLVEAYLDKLLPSNWSTLDSDDRKYYFRNIGEDSIFSKGTEIRQTVCVLEIWTEAFGNLPASLKRTDSFEVSGIMKKLAGWENKGRVIVCGPYGKQKVFERIGQPSCNQNFRGKNSESQR